MAQGFAFGLCAWAKLTLDFVPGPSFSIDLHRDAVATAGARQKKKLLAKSNWFKQKKKTEEPGDFQGKKQNFPSKGQKASSGDLTPKTVLFVPRTPGGELVTRLRKAEQEISRITGETIKIVEKAGTMIKRLVHKANPWAGENCGRPDCLVCHLGQDVGGDCRRRNVLYRTICNPCKMKGKTSVYFGETSRTAYERGKEHLRDFKDKNEDSHMWTHVMEEHQGDDAVNFDMKVLRGHMSAFSRQVHEAVVILRNRHLNLLNSKEEYNRCILPRIGVMMGEKEHGEVDNKEGPKASSSIEEMQDDEVNIMSGNSKKRKEENPDLQARPKKKRRKSENNTHAMRPKRAREMSDQDESQKL